MYTTIDSGKLRHRRKLYTKACVQYLFSVYQHTQSVYSSRTAYCDDDDDDDDSSGDDDDADDNDDDDDDDDEDGDDDDLQQMCTINSKCHTMREYIMYATHVHHNLFR